jgi:VWFA-related protein
MKWNPQTNSVELRLDNPEDTLDEGDVIRIDTSLVSSDLLVLDKRGNSVAGLTVDDFVIAEDGVPQTVGHFFNGDNVSVPRTIVLIIDYSGSQLPYLQNSIKAARVLVDKLGPNDLMAIVTDDVELFHDFTSDKKKLKKKLDQLMERPKGDLLFFSGKPRVGLSKQYSALMATLNEAFEDSDVRPIIIFQTDGDEAYFLRNAKIEMTLPEGLEGEELEKAKSNLEFFRKLLEKNQTEFSLDDLYRAVEKSRATLYTVVPGVKLLGLPPKEQVEKMRADQDLRLIDLMNRMTPDFRKKFEKRLGQQSAREVNLEATTQRMAKLQEALAVVAALTGGWTEFLETPEQAEDIYARVFSDINQRYIVGYYPTNKERDGKRRKIDFEVKGHPEYQVLGRRSYFAPSP